VLVAVASLEPEAHKDLLRNVCIYIYVYIYICIYVYLYMSVCVYKYI